MNLGVHLPLCHRHSQVCPILARFVDYYSPFWGPKAIYMVVEPQGVLMCRSSTLTILANSGPFRALLLTVRGPEGFPQWMIPGVRLRVRRQHTQFWQILTRFVDYYSPFWGPEKPA